MEILVNDFSDEDLEKAKELDRKNRKKWSSLPASANRTRQLSRTALSFLSLIKGHRLNRKHESITQLVNKYFSSEYFLEQHRKFIYKYMATVEEFPHNSDIKTLYGYFFRLSWWLYQKTGTSGIKPDALIELEKYLV